MHAQRIQQEGMTGRLAAFRRHKVPDGKRCSGTRSETDFVALPTAPGYGNPFLRIFTQIGDLGGRIPLHRCGNVLGLNKRIVAGNILQTGILEKSGTSSFPTLHSQ